MLLQHSPCSLTVVLDAYKWLVCYLLKDSDQRLQSQLAMGKDSFTARNDSQTYFCRSLALAYIEVGPCHRNHEILLLLCSLAGRSAASAVWCVCVCVWCVCVCVSVVVLCVCVVVCVFVCVLLLLLVVVVVVVVVCVCVRDRVCVCVCV